MRAQFYLYLLNKNVVIRDFSRLLRAISVVKIRPVSLYIISIRRLLIIKISDLDGE